MKRTWPYAAVAAACAAAGFAVGPLVVRLRQTAAPPAVAWGEGADYEGYRRPSRVDARWRENRGHAFSLKDREETVEADDARWARVYAGVPRLRPQPGGCLECHAGATLKDAAYYDLRQAVDRPVGCADCHDGESAALRIVGTGPVCARCHSEYYFEGNRVKHPWSRGLALEQIEQHYDALGYFDWEHGETSAAVLKVRHPQYEMWSQGVHARSGVGCADCHMPTIRRGGARVTDHRAASPLEDAGRACGPCHAGSGAEMKARAAAIQERTAGMMSRALAALVALLDETRGAEKTDLRTALEMQRKAQLRLDFVRADRSRGFHAPQEALRLLAEAIDYARQGQISAAAAPKSRGPSAGGGPRN